MYKDQAKQIADELQVVSLYRDDSQGTIASAAIMIRRMAEEIESLHAEIQRFKTNTDASVHPEIVGWIVEGGKKNGRLLYPHEYEFELIVPKVMCSPLVRATSKKE
jgi:hypothetical protein